MCEEQGSENTLSWALPPYHDFRDVAPLADALGVVGVGGAVFPLGGGGGEGFGIGVIGAGVEGEEGPVAGAAVHLDFQGFLAVFGPEDIDFAAVQAEGDFRGEGGGIDVGGVGADDAEGGTDSIGVGGGGFHLADEFAEAGEDAGGDGGRWGRDFAGGHGLGDGEVGPRKEVSLVADPLAASVLHGAGVVEDVAEVSGIRRLRGHGGGGEAEGGGVGGDGVAKALELGGFPFVVFGEIVGFGHNCWSSGSCGMIWGGEWGLERHRWGFQARAWMGEVCRWKIRVCRWESQACARSGKACRW